LSRVVRRDGLTRSSNPKGTATKNPRSSADQSSRETERSIHQRLKPIGNRWRDLFPERSWRSAGQHVAGRRRAAGPPRRPTTRIPGPVCRRWPCPQSRVPRSRCAISMLAPTSRTKGHGAGQCLRVGVEGLRHAGRPRGRMDRVIRSSAVRLLRDSVHHDQAFCRFARCRLIGHLGGRAGWTGR